MWYSEKRKQIKSINDIIGEPEYFPMPSAFDTVGGPNPVFTTRCNELRQLIYKYCTKIDKTNSYQSISDWSGQMIQIWDQIVKFENVLTPGDFKLP